MDVTHRFLMECLRMYPIVPMSIRNVMNSCVVEGYELPVGSRIFIVLRPPLRLKSSLTPTPSYRPLFTPAKRAAQSRLRADGLGTHTCLGFRWMELAKLAVNVLMVAHYFTLEVSPKNYKLNPRCRL